MRYWSLVLGALLFLLPTSNAQGRLKNAINSFAKDPAVKHASWSICVIDVGSGQLIGSYESQRSLIPASTLKTVTTSTALGILGPTYTFPTSLEYSGSITADGTLNGNLFINGSGDPTLGSTLMDGTSDLSQLLQKFRTTIQEAGIRAITGYLVGDGSKYESAGHIPSWQWADMGNYYGSGAFGLNINENQYTLRFKRTRRLGETPPIVAIEPNISGLEFVNELTSASSGNGGNAYIYGTHYSYFRYVRGTIGVGSGYVEIEGSVPDPPLLAAQQLEQNLNLLGILSTKGATTHILQPNLLKGKRTVLYTHYSPSLTEIVTRANMKSVNLYCESLLKAIALKQKGKGTIDGGLELVESYWKQKGLSFSGVDLKDGSGLSSKNLVTTQFMAELLRKMAKEEAIFDSFYYSLPVASQSGTLRGMFRGTAAAGKIRAKSGSLSKVRSYAGYATARSGKLLSFCVIVNNYSGSSRNIRSKIERLLTSLCQ